MKKGVLLITLTKEIMLTYKQLLKKKKAREDLFGLCSFRSYMETQERQNQICDHVPHIRIANKVLGHKFASRFMKVPCSSFAIYKFDEILVKIREGELEGRVLKPSSSLGSKGVFLFLQDGIYSCRARKFVDSGYVETETRKMLSDGRIVSDKFIIEDLILSGGKPANDVKFYCFYGEILPVLYIDRFTPNPTNGLNLCYHNVDGNVMDFRSVFHETFEPTKLVTKDDLNLIRFMSESIPAPFVRIDTLMSDEGLVFGEFTAGTGNFCEIKEYYDRLMGDYYAKAQAKIISDMLSGKTFDDTFKKKGNKEYRYSTPPERVVIV